MRHAVGEIVKMEVHRLSLHNFGCRVVQKVLEVLPRTNNYIIAQALKGHVIELIRDQKGNHVIQKALECVDRDKMSFVCHALVGQVSPRVAVLLLWRATHFLLTFSASFYFVDC